MDALVIVSRATVLISVIVALAFIVVSLFIDDAVERVSVLLYSIPCLLFGILVCVFELGGG